jgi:hypothetical protein
MTAGTETKEQKRIRMAQLGYVPATRAGLCALCGKQIAVGQYVGKMPDSWQPTLKRRHSHRCCLEALKAKVRAKAERLGVVVPAGSRR